MKLVIPPEIRRILQTLPPIDRLTVPLPLPPNPEPEPIDIPILLLQLLGVFIVSNIVLRFSRTWGGILLSVGIIVIVFRVLFAFRLRQSKLNKHQKKVSEYLLSLSLYGLAEKTHYEMIAREHAPRKVKEFRQQGLKIYYKKLPEYQFMQSFETTTPPDRLQFNSWYKIYFHHPLTVPGLSNSYCPDYIFICKQVPIVILIDLNQDNYNWEQESLISNFCNPKGWIWVQGNLNELETIEQELDSLLRLIGGNDENKNY